MTADGVQVEHGVFSDGEKAGPLEDVREQLRALRALRAALEESANEAERELLEDLGPVQVEEDDQEGSLSQPNGAPGDAASRAWAQLFERWENDGDAEQLHISGEQAAQQAAQRRDALLLAVSSRRQRTLQRVNIAQRDYDAHRVRSSGGVVPPRASGERRFQAVPPYERTVTSALEHSVLGKLARRAAEARLEYERELAHARESDEADGTLGATRAVGEYSVDLDADEVVRAARLLQLCEFMERRDAGEVHPSLLPFRLHEDEFTQQQAEESAISDSGDEDMDSPSVQQHANGHKSKRKSKNKNSEEPGSLRLQVNPLHGSGPSKRADADTVSPRKNDTPRGARRRLLRFFSIWRSPRSSS
eukprot:CAMPEP_0174243814 /NCGR_PEP_ID=MMETSP0417-20130205/32917_1 /TAXON_ID=242541 /ORGANISM="Mayorella sp, Strain BSH-02190019" /LENGTH=361 /DNA_ID=CAMNT_0015323397 /DNA_START=90 /DNA_END=1175 /DNA_ORIENTATION=+